MTNPESPDYAALIKDGSNYAKVNKDDFYEGSAADLVDELVTALRALLKVRNKLDNEATKLAIENSNLRKERDELSKKHHGAMQYIEGQKVDIEGLQSKLEQYDKALERLCDGQSFDVPKALHPFKDKELMVRMDFAKTELERIRKL